ncbi:hypothetical protein [Tenuifilum osseticum]|uniref:hypothetical protein n=1 Tax=Tenuifilum TaxID=2760873 RepID=UPI0030A6FF95
MKELYNTVLARLTDRVPAIRMIDFDMGQLEALASDLRPAVAFPCCLIDMELSCEDNDLNGQLVTARVILTLAFEQPLPTDSLSPAIKRNQALQLFDVIDQVHVAMQGYSTNMFSAFSRRSLSPDRRFAGIRVYSCVYETTFTDDV